VRRRKMQIYKKTSPLQRIGASRIEMVWPYMHCTNAGCPRQCKPKRLVLSVALHAERAAR
jgi:hypothetical protein